MEPANLKAAKDWQKSQDRASPSKVIPIAKPDEQIQDPPRKGLRLDVDEILRHSLPKLSSQSIRRVSKEIEE